MADENDKGVRKFRAMLIGLGFVTFGFCMTAWRGWPESIFETYCLSVFGLVAGFKATNVIEKFRTTGVNK